MKYSLAFFVLMSFLIYGANVKTRLFANVNLPSGNATDLSKKKTIFLPDGSPGPIILGPYRGGTINHNDGTGVVVLIPMPYKGPSSVVEYPATIELQADGNLKWSYRSITDEVCVVACFLTDPQGKIISGEIEEKTPEGKKLRFSEYKAVP